MRKFSLTILIAITCLNAIGQVKDEPPAKSTKHKSAIIRPSRCPKAYITTSTGLNNNTGLIGFSFDIPVEKYISVEAGAGTGPGISTWGYKLAVSGKFYLSPCQRGWAFSTGLTFNTGIQGYKSTLETIYGDETVKMNLNSQINVQLSAFHYWNLGKRNNRFYAQAGWSIPLSGGSSYEVVSYSPLSDNSKTMMSILSPGGPIIACGFSFGIY